MLKKEIKFKDLEDRERTGIFYFALNEVEIGELETEFGQGLEVFLKHLVETEDGKRLLELFKNIILQSYGEKDEDGIHFLKSEEISKRFSFHPAYVELYKEMLSDTNAAVEFFKGVVPADLQKAVEEAQAGGNFDPSQISVAPATTTVAQPPPPPVPQPGWSLPPAAPGTPPPPPAPQS